MSENEETPVDRLLDLFVFAPVGLALTVVEELPAFAAKGRNRIEGQAATARMLGQFAVQFGSREISKRVHEIVDQGSARVRPPRPKPSETKPVQVKPVVSKPVPQEPVVPGEAVLAEAALAESVLADAADAALADEMAVADEIVATRAEPVASRGAESNGHGGPDLAIPGYDTLSASQVVKRLAGLSYEELVDVGEHERTHRHRATIMSKVEQLLADEPSPGVGT